MKKHVLLAVGIAALYLAAKEYGINSIDDLKRVLRPYLNALDLDEISALLKEDHPGSSPGENYSPASAGRITDIPHES